MWKLSPDQSKQLELSGRDFKAALDQWPLTPTRVSPEFDLAVELTAHELNQEGVLIMSDTVSEAVAH